MSFPRREFLPFSKPSINEEDIAGVVESLKSGWITTGPKTAKFEGDFRNYVGAPHACSLNSATAGMHVLLHLLDLKPGDEVITPSLTWVSTVNLITLLGAKPIFAEIDPDNLMTSPELVEGLITSKTRAIIPVHYAGAPVDLDGFRALTRKYGVKLIEDAAHALGTEYRGRRIGSEGTAVFSFHPIKNITTSEGGMIVSDDEDLIEKARILKFHGLAKDAWDRYSRRGSNQVEVIFPGFKYNMTDLQASLGLTQLPRLEGFNRRRTELAEIYDEKLAEIEELILLRAPAYPHLHSHHLYIVLLDIDKAGMGRDAFLAALKERNIGTGIHFRAAHTQQYYREKYGPGLLPQTEWVSERLFSLPFFPEMSDGDIDDVADAVKDVLKKG